MSKNKAFTLIELLVVITIIAILAAILFPVFAQARFAAKKSADLSNVKQISLGIMQYTIDNDDYYPSAYFHRAFNPALGGTNSGYVHWSEMIQTYVKNRDIFVSPVDKIGGHAPTCFSSSDNNSGAGIPSGQQANVCSTITPLVPSSFVRGGVVVDEQVPRISYTVNSAVIPRLRNINDVNRGISVVSSSFLDNTSNTILIAGFTDNLSCLASASITSVVRSASHRSTNGYSIDQANTRAYFGSAEDGASRPSFVYSLNHNRVTTGSNQIFNLCKTTPRTDYPLAVYTGGGRIAGGDNYGLSDGSARFKPFSQTLSASNYMWGTRVYTDGGIPVFDPVTGSALQY
jgi:prepilin-type N-terminal cleavage/methylation domain-containing protein